MNVQKKFTIIVCFICLTCITLTAFIGYYAASNELKAKSTENAEILASNYANQINNWIWEKAVFLNTLTESVILVNNLDREYLHTYFQDMLKHNNPDDAIYDVFFQYPDSYMVCATDFVPDGTMDYTKRKWYTAPTTTHKLSVQTAYMDTDTKREIITISREVVIDGELKGVLAVDIFVDQMVDTINAMEVPEDSYGFLLDSDYGLVVHPNEDFGYVNAAPLSLAQLEGNPYEELITAIDNGAEPRQLLWIEDYDGETRAFFVSQVESCGWYVGIAIAESVWAKAVRSLLVEFALIMVVLSFIISFLSVSVVVRALLKPVSLAESASKAKSDFLANMSHEIRTPIHAMLGMNELILREAEGENISRYAVNIRNAGKMLLSLVNDILDFSKIESGKMEIMPVEYELCSMLSDLINMIAGRLEEKGLELKLDIVPDIPHRLWGDERRITQIIGNLLINAVKYTKEGTVILHVGWRKLDEQQIELLVEVEDTGIGIRPEELNLLFISFTRLDEGRNGSIEGTGLGLNITKSLLDMMAGQLNVRSVYGRGSVFSAVIPQKVISYEGVGDFQEKYENSVKQRRHYKESFTAPEGKILIVDDNAMNLAVVTGLLKNTKLQIHTASNGRECLEKVTKNTYHVIFMDHMMPELDGLETFERMKALSGNLSKAAPVIALTANAISNAKKMYLDYGFTDYLSKPIEGSKLERILLEYLPPELVHLMEVPEKIIQQEVSGKEEETGLEDYINREIGLAYSGGQPEKYLEILHIYAQMGPEFLQNIEAAYKAADWKLYAILVHGLKSTSLGVGAEELSKRAERLETAAKSGEADYIYQHHGKLCDMYEKVIEQIGSYLRRIEKKSVVQGDGVKMDAERADQAIPVPLLKERLLALDESISTFERMEAQRILEELWEKSCQGLLLADDMQDISHKLENFEYEEAKKTIHLLLGRF